MRAGSFSVQTQAPARVARALEEQLARVGGSPPAGGAVVFTCGQLAQDLPAVADAIAALNCPVPVLIAAGTGVLDQDHEIEDQSAATGMVWTGGRAEGVVVPHRKSGGESGPPDDLGETLTRIISDRTARTAPTVLLFTRSEGFSPEILSPLYEARGTPYVFGGGTVGPHGSCIVPVGGRPEFGAASMLFLRGIAPPQLRASPACRLLTPLQTVTEVRGSMLLEIAGEPALDFLNQAGEKLGEERVLFIALAPDESAPTQGGRAELMLRGVQGVDPARRGILVSEEVHVGMRVGLAVRDAAAARADLDAVTRELVRDIRGAAPCFGLYVNCAGRGSSLYGQYDVDTRLLRQRFAGMPIAGLASAFEVGPHAGRPALQLYAGVLALFTAPS